MKKHINSVNIVKNKHLNFEFFILILINIIENMIKGLDDDEIEFLDLVDRKKLAEERRKNIEEEKEMRDFKKKVASLQEKSLGERLKLELKTPQSIQKITSRYELQSQNSE